MVFVVHRSSFKQSFFPLQKNEAKGLKKSRDADDEPVVEPEEPKTKKVKKNKGAKVRPDPLIFNWFGDYDLEELEIPLEAWPQPNKTHTGKHGYTVTSQNGAVHWLVELNFICLLISKQKYVFIILIKLFFI